MPVKIVNGAVVRDDGATNNDSNNTSLDTGGIPTSLTAPVSIFGYSVSPVALGIGGLMMFFILGFKGILFIAAGAGIYYCVKNGNSSTTSNDNASVAGQVRTLTKGVPSLDDEFE